METPMREWQARAIDEYQRRDAQDFLLEATPGAGKTRAAVAIASRLIEQGTVGQVVVVAPTDALRDQWASTSGLNLRPYDGDYVITKAGYDGIVVTYQQLGAGGTADLLRHASGSTPILAIFDEIHHAGESRSWSEGLVRAFEHATRRLALTGTPWRRDNNPIPFVTYGENKIVVPDYHYRYGRAVSDGVCRPIVFDAYNGDARWVDCGRIIEARIGADIDDDDIGAAMDTIYNPTQQWIPALLAKADEALTEIRTDVPDAGMLVIAEQQWQAKAYAEILFRITGEKPTLVLSDGTDGADAKKRIDKFRRGRTRCIVAVKMVSEGIDIPRLSVGVFAAKAKTPLFFRQVVGRLVRTRPDESHNALLFIPAVPALVRHALEIEQELLHELAEQAARAERAAKAAEGQQQTFDLRMPLSASEPIFDRSIHRGENYAQPDVEQGRALCEQYGIPLNLAMNIARIMRDKQMMVVGLDVTVGPAPDPTPTYQLEKQLRAEVNRMTRRLDHIEDREKGATNYELREYGFPARKECSVVQLQAIREYLAGRLGG